MDRKFIEETIDNLKVEIECLGKKLKRFREVEDFSNYKLIVNCYRETITILERVESTYNSKNN